MAPQRNSKEQYRLDQPSEIDFMMVSVSALDESKHE